MDFFFFFWWWWGGGGQRVDKNIYKSINLNRAAFVFGCKFKISSKVD